MNPPVKVVNGQLTCLKGNHNGPVKMILMDDQVPLYDRLLCYKCFEAQRSVSRYISIEEAQGLIQEKLYKLNNKQEEQTKEILLVLSDFQNKIMNIRQRVIQQIDEIQRISQLWIQDLKNVGRKQDVNNFMEDLKLLSQVTEPPNLNKSNQSYSTKINMIIQKLLVQDDILSCQNCIDSIFKVKFEKPIQNKPNFQLNVKKVLLVNTVKQKEPSVTIVFNSSGSIMVSGCKNDIQVWSFVQGKMVEKKRLTGHSNVVACLVYSKRHNWFASGSRDNTIRCWREIDNNWISASPGKSHTNYIYCLLLNRNEDQLISCSQDQTIKVWRVDCEFNQIEFDYTFENRHSGTVYGLSICESEQNLVSCGGDKKIILWKQGQNYGRWQYQSELLMEDLGYRISFINDNQIIWQQSSRGIIHLLENDSGKLMKRPYLNLNLNNETCDFPLFPTVKNSKKQVIIQKHNRYVYIIKQHSNGQLMIVSDPIDCNAGGISGNLTEDGEYLAIWNEEAKEFRVFKIIYELINL